MLLYTGDMTRGIRRTPNCVFDALGIQYSTRKLVQETSKLRFEDSRDVEWSPDRMYISPAMIYWIYRTTSLPNTAFIIVTS
jgi:hypothetical protein